MDSGDATSKVIDGARPVRAGEELDMARLAPFLRRELGLADDAPIEVAQFPGGHSNLTYLVRAGEREYALRRPPFGSKVKTAHDMGREVRVLSKLAPLWPKAPRPVVVCEDEAVLGARFYLMERLRGVILRRDPPKGLTVDARAAGRLCEALVETMAELHAVDWRAAGIDLGKPEGYVARQVAGWTERYGASKTDDIPAVDEIASWLADHQPPLVQGGRDGRPGGDEAARATLIHNDFKFDNLVLDPTDIGRVVGVLDWEMATVGDPLMDLGTALCYWVEPNDAPVLQLLRFGPTTLPGMWSRRQLADHYAARTGRDLSHIVFYFCFGLFKTAVVAQQIYYRWKHGFTKDERFGQLVHAVRALAEQAVAASARSTL